MWDNTAVPDERAPAEPEPEEYHLHTELGHELKRLGTHPIKEIERLSAEARDGEVETTPAIVIAGIALWLWILVTVVIAASFLVVYLVVVR